MSLSGGWGFGGEVLQPVAPAPASGVSCRCPAEPGCCCVGTGVPHSCRLLEDPALGWCITGGPCLACTTPRSAALAGSRLRSPLPGTPPLALSFSPLGAGGVLREGAGYLLPPLLCVAPFLVGSRGNMSPPLGDGLQSQLEGGLSPQFVPSCPLPRNALCCPITQAEAGLSWVKRNPAGPGHTLAHLDVPKPPAVP